MVPAGPEDVVHEIEKWQSRHSASKYGRVAEAIHAGVARMERFSESIDMLAQGAKGPGCLIWGSIKFVLVVGEKFLVPFVENIAYSLPIANIYIHMCLYIGFAFISWGIFSLIYTFTSCSLCLYAHAFLFRSCVMLQRSIEGFVLLFFA